MILKSKKKLRLEKFTVCKLAGQKFIKGGSLDGTGGDTKNEEVVICVETSDREIIIKI